MGAWELLIGLASEGFSVTADGDRLLIRPASRVTDAMRSALRVAKPDLLALLHGATAKAGPKELDAVAWTDADIARFNSRRNRLMQWGWPEGAVEAQAERLARRDREGDTRVSCTDCLHYVPGQCQNYRRAGLCGPAVGRDLATLLQNCPGFWSRRL